MRVTRGSSGHGLHRPDTRLGVGHHRAELQRRKCRPCLPHPLLCEEDGTPIFDLDQCGQDKRTPVRRRAGPHPASDDVERPLGAYATLSGRLAHDLVDTAAAWNQSCDRHGTSPSHAARLRLPERRPLSGIGQQAPGSRRGGQRHSLVRRPDRFPRAGSPTQRRCRDQC